jgi:hypothetical protein
MSGLSRTVQKAADDSADRIQRTLQCQPTFELMLKLENESKI